VKGQLSLEALLLTLFQIVSLALIVGVSFLFLQATDKMVEKYNYLKEHHWLLEVAKEVCVLGDGQRRPVRLRFAHNISTECGELSLGPGSYVLENQQGTLRAFQ